MEPGPDDAPSFEGSGLTTMFEGAWATVQRLRKGKLVVVSGADQGKELEIVKPRVTGGRSIISDLVLADKAVSGTHFEIAARDDGYRLRDLNSRNGVYVGDLRIREVFLRPGTVFRLGHTSIQFQPMQDIVEIELSKRDRFDAIIGGSAAMRQIFAQLEKVAPSDLTVLITGETGTGKEMVARAVHNASPRKAKPFVVLDCGSIPKELIESTLFGHEKGSFTGAIGQHLGCFEQANGGTIFLDEIGELDITLQPKLLRVLEQREIKRVGGDKTIKVDVRVLAATNRDLREEVNKGNFREDLYFRLSVVHVELPPMRERKEDVASLANHFLRDIAGRRGMQMSFGPDAMAAMLAHPWWTSGDERIDLALHRRATEPWIGKIGARGVFCVALPARGLGLALKVHDGDEDALAVAVPAVVERIAPGALAPAADWPWATIHNVAGRAVGTRVAVGLDGA